MVSAFALHKGSYTINCWPLNFYDNCFPPALSSRPTHYFETAVARLANLSVQILFSRSETHTASILTGLCRSEGARGHGIDLSEEDMQRSDPAALQLLMKVPNMTYLTALSMCCTFHSLQELVNW